MKSNERIIAEAMILGAELVESCEADLTGHMMVKAYNCPYCGATNTSAVDAEAHDGACTKHPLAVRVAELEARLAELTGK